MKNKTIKKLSIFHRFTVLLAICYLSWSVWVFEVEVPAISTLLEVIIPSFFDTLGNGNPLKPTDFVNYFKYKIWLYNY